MYTTAQSIENKVGGVNGWKDLLQAVGFRFEPSLNGLPPAVFFPQSDPGDRLTQASASLQALLGTWIADGFVFFHFSSEIIFVHHHRVFFCMTVIVITVLPSKEWFINQLLLMRINFRVAFHAITSFSALTHLNKSHTEHQRR